MRPRLRADSIRPLMLSLAMFIKLSLSMAMGSFGSGGAINAFLADDDRSKNRNDTEAIKGIFSSVFTVFFPGSCGRFNKKRSTENKTIKPVPPLFIGNLILGETQAFQIGEQR